MAAFSNAFNLVTKKTPTFALDHIRYFPSWRSSIRTLRNLPTAQTTGKPAQPAQIATSVILPYLRDACGLSTESAEVIISKRFRLRTIARAEAVLHLLAEYGLSRDSVTTLVTRFPDVLNADPNRTLRPKLEFLRSAGFAPPVLGDVLATNPRILHTSLERKLTPCVCFLKTLVPANMPTVPFMAEVLKVSCQLVTEEHLPNFRLLENHGVPRLAVLKLLLTRPRALVLVPSRLEKIVTRAKHTGLRVDSAMFLHLVGILSFMSDDTLIRKMKLLKDIGWSDDEAMMAVRVQPMWLCVSDQELQKRANFFREVLLWDPGFVASNSSLLLYSLGKHFVPRCSVLNLLMQRGFLLRISTGPLRFLLSEKAFQERYVRPFQEKLPQVVEAYKAKCFEGWERGCWDEYSYIVSRSKPCR